MEDCRLRIRLPSNISAHPNLSLGPKLNNIDIWILQSLNPLNAKRLTWNSRPLRTIKLDAVQIVPGMEYTFKFDCPLNSLWAFEFSARDAECHVTWAQNHSDLNPRES
jgi:hypothetical protein